MISPRRLPAPGRRRLVRAAGLLLALALLWAMPTSTAAFSSASTRSGTFATDTLDPPSGFTATRSCPTVSAPAFRAASSASTGGPSATASTPAGLQQNDVMVAMVYISGWDTIVAPTGWTELHTDINAETGAYSRASVFWKRATASEPTSYTFDWNDIYDDGIVTISAYSGVDTVTAVDGSTLVENPYSTSAPAPSVTTATAPTRLVVGVGALNTTSSELTAPSSVTVRAAQEYTGFGLVKMADQALSTTGSTGTRLFTNANPHYSHGATVALRAPDPPASSASLDWTATPDTYATGYQLVRTGTDGSSATSSIAGRTTVSHSETLPSRTTGYSYALRSVSGSWLSSAVSASIAAC